MSLANRVALVSGAGQGIGLGIAKQLASDGALVLVNDIDGDRAAAAAQSIIGAGGRAEAAVFDVSCIDTVLTAVAELEERVGGIDILVNNAGNAGNGPMHMLSFKDMPPEEWDKYLGVNLHGVLNCCKAVVNGMCDRGWGRLITISSEAGRVGLDINVSLYGVAKAGGAHLMRHLARELGPHGVTANVISLGLMDNVPEEFAGPVIRTIPLRRLGAPQDAAHAVSFLASDAAGWISGQTLPVNGASFAF